MCTYYYIILYIVVYNSQIILLCNKLITMFSRIHTHTNGDEILCLITVEKIVVRGIIRVIKTLINPQLRANCSGIGADGQIM